MNERQKAVFNAIHDVLERAGLPVQQRVPTVAVILNNLFGLGIVDFRIRRVTDKSVPTAEQKKFPTPEVAWDLELTPEDEIKWIG